MRSVEFAKKKNLTETDSAMLCKHGLKAQENE